jgi:glucose/mannose-6-phosphate isomerase
MGGHVAFAKAAQVVVMGMGGSAYAARFVAHNGAMQKKPVLLVNGYTVPAWVGKETAVLIVSYSGNTAEAVGCAKKAIALGAQVGLVACDGALARLARLHQVPLARLSVQQNPSAQPRLGTASTFGAVLGALTRWGAIALTADAATSERRILERFQKDMARQARAAAKKLFGRMPMMLGAGHLEGVVFSARNVLMECAKCFAVALPLPEAHHNAFEGMEHPSDATDTLCGVLFESKKYSALERHRVAVSRTVLLDMGIPPLRVELPGKSQVSDAICAIWWAAYTGLELARLEQTDALNIPWIERIKGLM